MNILVIDVRECESAEWQRASTFKAWLSPPHAVSHWCHVHGGDVVQPWTTTLVEHVAQQVKAYDLVLLHIGNRQRDALEALNTVFRGRRVVCYWGGWVPEVEREVAKDSWHAIYRKPIGEIPDDFMRRALMAYMDALQEHPNDPNLARRALNRHDANLEKNLEYLCSSLEKIEEITPEAIKELADERDRRLKP